MGVIKLPFRSKNGEDEVESGELRFAKRWICMEVGHIDSDT